MIKTPRPTTATLQAFECAARNGSFTRAAIELNVTQGAISRQIRQLEAQLGVLLFERVHQRVVLTEVGRRYRDDVRRALDQLEHATERAMACVDVDHVITVAVAPTFSSNWLAPRLSAFSEAYPHLTINCLMWLPRFDFGDDHISPAMARSRIAARRISSASSVAMSAAERSKPATSALVRMRSAWRDFGITTTPCWRCQRMITWAGVRPSRSAIERIAGCSRVPPRRAL